MVASMLENPNITPEVLEKMVRCVGDDTWSLGEILRHPKTPKSAANYVAHYTGEHELETLLKNYTEVPVEALDWLSDHDSAKIRALVAEQSNTPPEILTRLASDPSKVVQFWVANNPNTPESLKKRLADKFDVIGGKDYWDEQEELAKNPKTPPEFLRHLAQTTKNGTALRLLAENPNTPADVLSYLANDPFYQTRVAVNRSTPPEVLDKLSRTHDLYQRRLVAANPNASEATLKRLAKSSDWRTLDAGNPNTPYSVLQRLMETAGDDDSMRNIISNNPSYENH